MRRDWAVFKVPFFLNSLKMAMGGMLAYLIGFVIVALATWGAQIFYKVVRKTQSKVAAATGAAGDGDPIPGGRTFDGGRGGVALEYQDAATQARVAKLKQEMLGNSYAGRAGEYD